MRNCVNGYHVYHGLLAGYERLLGERGRLNDINVFPVADGDTGTNMVSTVYSTLQLPRVHRSLSKTLSALADRSLSAARGNSGIILAQFLNSLSAECASLACASGEEFAGALSRAARDCRKALEDPREGTILSVLSAWAGELESLASRGGALKAHFLESLDAARKSLEETRFGLAELRKAGVVDSGASGLVAILEGIARVLASGFPRARARFSPLEERALDGDSHADHPADGMIPHRYCTEALVASTADPALVRHALSGLGDSLIVTRGETKTRVHMHTNDPASLIATLGRFGNILEQKVDDMVLQYRAAHEAVSRVAIVTDSIADILLELVERYQIHVVPLRILWGASEYLDRLTMDARTFYSELDLRDEYPSSSIPDPVRVEQVFSWLAAHYDSIVAIPVGKRLSGTYQVFANAGKKLNESGFRITVIDSRLNSAAQGLVALAAADDAAKGFSHDEIVARTERRIKGARILVSVSTFKYMVRGGRISALKGAVAALTHLKPVITLDEAGKGVAFGASLTQSRSMRKIASYARGIAPSGSRFAVVHASSPERAERFAHDLSLQFGRGPEYVMEISPIVGMHAGLGAVAVAWIEDVDVGGLA